MELNLECISQYTHYTIELDPDEDPDDPMLGLRLFNPETHESIDMYTSNQQEMNTLMTAVKQAGLIQTTEPT